MTKTFTCRELGGICDEKFSGETFEDVMQKGVAHMMMDDEHKNHTMSLEEQTGENKEMWMERMKKEFEERPEDEVAGQEELV